jgi:hypothetical protein
MHQLAKKCLSECRPVYFRADLTVSIQPRDPRGDLNWPEQSVDQVDVKFDTTDAVWEDEVEWAVRTGQLPFPQSRYHCWWQGDGTSCGFGLRVADVPTAIGALRNRQLRLLQVHVGPRQTAQLRGAQAGKHGDHQEHPILALGSLQHESDFIWRRNIHSGLE